MNSREGDRRGDRQHGIVRTPGLVIDDASHRGWPRAVDPRDQRSPQELGANRPARLLIRPLIHTEPRPLTALFSMNEPGFGQDRGGG